MCSNRLLLWKHNLPVRSRSVLTGAFLQDVYKDNHGNLPEVFTESIEILRQRGLSCKGLFCGRCEGRKAKLLEKAWDMGRNPLKAASFTDCYAVRSEASLAPLKVYTFRLHLLSSGERV